MERLIYYILILFLLFSINSCGVERQLSNISTDGISHEGTDIYYKGEMMATMSSLEIALDGKKIVREVTFIIQDEKFDHLAIPIIKYVKTKRPYWEIEVELKRNQPIQKESPESCH